MLHKILPAILRLLAKPFLSPKVSVGFQRRWSNMLLMGNPCAKKTSFDLQNIKGVPVRKIAPTSPTDKVVLYLHGGAYILGSPKGHRALCSYLASFSGATVYSVDYRLAPEHPYPAAQDDALAVYQQLLESGTQPENIMIAGDSAGGGLAAAVVLNIRDRGLAIPGKLFLISPFVDMTVSGESATAKAKADPMLRKDWLLDCGDKYRGNTPREHPDCSPLFADLKGFPPTLIHVGSEEILLDDARRFEKALAASGSSASLRVFDGYWHDFQLQPAMLPMARESLQEAADFLLSH